MPIDAIAKLATKYLHLELERQQLMDEVESSDLPSRQRIMDLLQRAGILSTLE